MDLTESNGSLHTHTHTTIFNGFWSGTIRVGQYQKKYSPTHTHPGHRTSFINFLHLLRSIAFSLFSLHARQSSLTTSLQVLFGLFGSLLVGCLSQKPKPSTGPYGTQDYGCTLTLNKEIRTRRLSKSENSKQKEKL